MYSNNPCDSIKKTPSYTSKPVQELSNGNNISITVTNEEKAEKNDPNTETIKDKPKQKEENHYFIDFIKEILPNLFTVVITTIGAIFALIQVKLNAITTARIAWIESLRENLSSFIREINYISSVINKMNDDIKQKEEREGKSSDNTKILEKAYEDIMDRARDAEKYSVQIRLYLNTDELNHRNLIELLDKFADESWSEDIKKSQDLTRKLEEEILSASRKIFKEEWEKVKKFRLFNFKIR